MVNKTAEASPEAIAKRKRLREAKQAAAPPMPGGAKRGKEPPFKGSEKGTRDEKGRFTPGHSAPGPGRPSAETDASYADAFRRACSPTTFSLVVEGVVAKALKGDIQACRLLFKHGLPSLVEIVTNNKFRVAGESPHEVNTRMLKLVHQKINEQAQRDAEQKRAARRVAKRSN